MGTVHQKRENQKTEKHCLSAWGTYYISGFRTLVSFSLYEKTFSIYRAPSKKKFLQKTTVVVGLHQKLLSPTLVGFYLLHLSIQYI